MTLNELIEHLTSLSEAHGHKPVEVQVVFADEVSDVCLTQSSDGTILIY